MKKSGKLRRAWWNLADRHFQIARILLSDYADGSYFHTYHAVECAVTATYSSVVHSQDPPFNHDEQ